jgi:enamine deaminase RidA (YjgF/YER057c/UK114 family)
MTTLQRISPPELYRDAPYHYATVAPAGSLVFTAGACPLDARGDVVEPGDLEAQTRRALDNLAVALAAAGVGLEQVLKTTVYVVGADRSDLTRAWAVVEERLGAARPPSSLLGVSLLGYPDQLVEIEAVALVPDA